MRGNRELNGLKSGANLDASRLVVGNLPRELLGTQREARAYRRDLESAVIAAKGNISVPDGHLIDTAAAATLHCSVCRWLLRTKIKTMKPADILNCTGAMVKAKTQRDAAVRALELDRDTAQDVIAQLYRPLPQPLPAPTPDHDKEAS